MTYREPSLLRSACRLLLLATLVAKGAVAQDGGASSDTSFCVGEDFGVPALPVWQSAGIGDADEGSAAVVGGRLRIQSDGSQLYHGPDHGFFFHQTVSGDFRAEVDVAALVANAGGTYRKACLSVRSSLATDAARVMVCLTPGHPTGSAVYFDVRQSDGATPVELGSTRVGFVAPRRLGLVRRGNKVTASFVDATGQWSEAAGGLGGTAEVALGASPVVGLMVSAYDTAPKFTVDFDNWRLCKANDAPAPVAGTAPTCDPGKPLDVVYLLDISQSMDANFPGAAAGQNPSKLAASRRFLERLQNYLALRSDGSRASMVTFVGDSSLQTNPATATQIRAPLGSLAATSAAVAALENLPRPGLTTTPTALALRQVAAQLTASLDPAHRPMLVFITDGLPNVDLAGRGSQFYEMNAVQAVPLRTPEGAWRPWSAVAWGGQYNRDYGTFDGEPLANAEWALQELAQDFPDLQIHSLGIRGDGQGLGAFHLQLVDFAAFVSGAQSFAPATEGEMLGAADAILGIFGCGAPGQAAVGDRVFNDLDGDGSPDIDEPGIPGVTVEARQGGNLVASTVTTAGGLYQLVGLPVGLPLTIAPVAASLPHGLDQWTTASSQNRFLAAFDVDKGVDFGLRAAPQAPTSSPETTTCTVEAFDDPGGSGVPAAPWQLTKVGSFAPDLGAATLAGGKLELSSNGENLFSGNDRFHLLQQPAPAGDFRFEATLEGFPVDPGGSAFRKAGLILTSGSGERAARVIEQVAPAYGSPAQPAILFGVRASEGAAGGALSVEVTNAGMPVRLAIERRGEVVSSLYSTDGGATWKRQTQGSQGGFATVALGENPQIGLAAASYNSSAALTARFDDVAICRPTAATPPNPSTGSCGVSLPLDVVFVLDASGSMASPLETSSRFAEARALIADWAGRLGARGDGSRAALVVDGGAQVVVRAGLGNVAALSEALAGLTTPPAANAGSSAALAIRRAGALLSGSGSGRRPLIVWLTDGPPSFDLSGRGAYFSETAPLDLTIATESGFLGASQVAWSGPFLGAFKTFGGQPSAEVMLELEAARAILPSLAVHSLALQGSGSSSSPVLRHDLLAWAAWLTGGSRHEGATLTSLATAADTLWNVASCNLLDALPPSIQMVAPPNGATLADTPSEIVLHWSDDVSGVDAASATFLLDGVDRRPAAVVDGSGLTLALAAPLAAGPHTVEATVADFSGKVGSGSFSFSIDVVDEVPPEITILSPAAGAVLAEAGAVVRVVVTDESPIATVIIGGQAATLVNGVYSALVFFQEGANTVQIEAVDSAGNPAFASLAVFVVTDGVAPTMALLAPARGSFTSEVRPLFEVSFEDLQSGVDTSTLSFAIAGAPLAVNCTFELQSALCRPVAALTDGEVALNVTLADFFGNVATLSSHFEVDSAGVEITITSPQDGFVTTGETLTVTGELGPGVVQVLVDEVPATLAGGSFSAEIPLREGIQVVVALAIKANGNSGTASIEAVRDLIAPIVTITSPVDGWTSTAEKVTITGYVNDSVSGGAEPTVWVNGALATVAGGSFIALDVPLLRGPNTIEAVARDVIGNEGRDQIAVQFRQPVGDRLLAISGNGQRAVVRQPLPDPLVVEVTDRLGNPVAGKQVFFEVSRNSGSLRTSLGAPGERSLQVATDGRGRAQVYFTLGDTTGEGNNRVRVTAVGADGEIELCASAIPSTADKVLMVNGDNQRGILGHPLPMPLEAMVVDADGNPLAGVAVEFRVEEGSGFLDGGVTQTRMTGIDGVARAVFTLGNEEGIGNHVVSATFAGHEGLYATFVQSGIAAGDPAQTTFRGVVLDNAQVPIPGVLVTIPGTTVSAVTDNEGRFLLTQVPTGHIHLRINPSDSPRPEVFPPLEFEVVTVAGRENDLGMPILLPAITGSAKVVGGDEDVTLTMPGVEGLEVTIFANSATFPNGARTGLMSISQVHFDKIPMAPPNGMIFAPPSWTLQPGGVHLDPPARVSLPNNGMAPGRVIDIYQFDHALYQFISVGKGTVTEDGSRIVTDPGFGVTRTGWGGGGQPQPPPTCPSSCDDNNACTRDFCHSRTGRCAHLAVFPNGCSDGKECTFADRCQAGACKGDPRPAGWVCGEESENQCTNNGCDGKGNCLTGSPKPDNTPCDDKKFCTLPDECTGGACQGEKVEDVNCGPQVGSSFVFVPELDFFFFDTPGFDAEYFYNYNVRKVCCEEKKQFNLITSEGSGTFNGEAPLNASVPVAGALINKIDKYICGKVLKLPFIRRVAYCEVTLEFRSDDGLAVEGTIGGKIDQCKDTKDYNGSGSIEAQNFGIFGDISISLLPGIDDDEDDFINITGTIGGGFNISGEIEGVEDVLLATLNASDLTATVSLDLPGLPAFSIPDLTIEGKTGIGPIAISGPPIPTGCNQ